MSTPKPCRSGYTLFEIILVLALLVVLTSLTYPSLDAMYGDYRVTAAADQVRGAWATARAAAMNEGTPYRFCVVPGKGNYRIAPDTSDYWTGGDAPSGEGTPIVIEEALPKGVRFAAQGEANSSTPEPGGETALPIGKVDSGQWTTQATFLPDGTSRDDVELTFRSKGTRPLVMKLRALTGVTTVKPWQADGSR